jgi:hypothetical protein
MFLTWADNINDAPENIQEVMMNNEIELSQDLENKLRIINMIFLM